MNFPLHVIHWMNNNIMKRYLEDDGYVWRTDYGGNRLYICDVSDKVLNKEIEFYEDRSIYWSNNDFIHETLSLLKDEKQSRANSIIEEDLCIVLNMHPVLFMYDFSSGLAHFDDWRVRDN